MSRFGDLLSGNATPAPSPEPVVEEPIVVAESPIVEEDSTNYQDEIEEEFVETFPYESDLSIHDMSKSELEEYGRTVGIELDRRHSRKRLVRELEEYLTDS
ncbi:hypothetical protein CMO86_09650 [Candidatus Woesearchaeota archaeon]|jgi:hypothetical protein|nr:hypothetical protein [Candidatus Woesearchaeota archaeon]|tara:strand:+ start:1696 stop:1998 length:303 start_codon:yes stop_codon:yes gene_type:complete